MRELPVPQPSEAWGLVAQVVGHLDLETGLEDLTWCALRPGEQTGLFRDDLDLQAGAVTIRRNRVELLQSPVAFDKTPNSAPRIPLRVLPVLAEHLESWAGNQRVFVGRTGAPMRCNTIRQATCPSLSQGRHDRIHVP